MNSKISHEGYYTHNKKYSMFLESQDRKSFEKYVQALIQYSQDGDSILDVGCGSGIALDMIRSHTKRKLFGLEISKESVKLCKSKKLNCKVYDGKNIPFKDKTFDVVSSMNTLEHTDNPVAFLNENLRVLKNNGYLVIACPNFLSITNNYHHHTQGFMQKLKNIVGIVTRLGKSNPSFSKMTTIDREDFQPDDDACNVTNQQDINIWAQKNQLRPIYTSSQQISRKGIIGILDKTPLKILFGSCFMVYQKR